MTVKEKIQEYLNYKGISPTAAERDLNCGVGSFTKVKSISSDRAKEFLLLYDDVSAEWLFRDEGEMLRSNTQSIGNITSSSAVGNNVNGSGNNISHSGGVSEMMQMQREYVMLLQKKDEQIDKLLEIINKIQK